MADLRPFSGGATMQTPDADQLSQAATPLESSPSKRRRIHTSRIIEILRSKATEQATTNEIRAALEQGSHKLGDTEFNRILEDMRDNDTVQLDEHGNVHLLT